MFDPVTVLTLVAMACVTYATRVAGFVWLRNRTLSPKAMVVLEATPGCVLISVIAPHFVSTRPADLIAIAVTLVAATRLPLLPTVVIAVTSAGLLRHVLG